MGFEKLGGEGEIVSTAVVLDQSYNFYVKARVYAVAVENCQKIKLKSLILCEQYIVGLVYILRH